jgi:excisionase family DNA binding protein
MNKQKITVEEHLQLLYNGQKSLESAIAKQTIQNKAVLSFNEAVEHTGYSPSRLYKLTSTGGIPCYRPGGGKLFFNKSELDTWLLQNRKATNAELSDKASTFVTLSGK